MITLSTLVAQDFLNTRRQRVTDYELQKLLKSIDDDSDGMVDFEEFMCVNLSIFGAELLRYACIHVGCMYTCMT